MSFAYHVDFLLPCRGTSLDRCGPTTPILQRLAAITQYRFGLFRFRSPLLTESRLLSLPVGTEMFHFPTFPPLALCVQARVTGHDSSRVSPFGHPRITARLPAPRGLIAGFYVLLRLLVPRHPPCALNNLATKYKDQMLASTVQFSRYGRDHPPTIPQPVRPGGVRSGSDGPRIVLSHVP